MAILGTSSIIQNEQVIPIAEIIVHPKFGGFSYKNDVALLRFSQTARWNDFVQPIRLPSWKQAKQTFKKEIGKCKRGKRSDFAVGNFLTIKRIVVDGF